MENDIKKPDATPASNSQFQVTVPTDTLPNSFSATPNVMLYTGAKHIGMRSNNTTKRETEQIAAMLMSKASSQCNKSSKELELFPADTYSNALQYFMLRTIDFAIRRVTPGKSAKPYVLKERKSVQLEDGTWQMRYCYSIEEDNIRKYAAALKIDKRELFNHCDELKRYTFPVFSSCTENGHQSTYERQIKFFDVYFYYDDKKLYTIAVKRSILTAAQLKRLEYLIHHNDTSDTEGSLTAEKTQLTGRIITLLSSAALSNQTVKAELRSAIWKIELYASPLLENALAGEGLGYTMRNGELFDNLLKGLTTTASKIMNYTSALPSKRGSIKFSKLLKVTNMEILLSRDRRRTVKSVQDEVWEAFQQLRDAGYFIMIKIEQVPKQRGSLETEPKYSWEISTQYVSTNKGLKFANRQRKALAASK